jgi:hypothetical protein
MLLATGDSPNGFEKWNLAQFTNPPGTFDLLTTHFITGTNHVLNPHTPDFMAAVAFALPYALGAFMAYGIGSPRQLAVDRTHRNPMFEAELSGVFCVLAPTR